MIASVEQEIGRAGVGELLSSFVGWGKSLVELFDTLNSIHT